MLAELKIKNFAIIDELHLEFSPSLNVITGETGAGKSLIVAALDLLLGQKLDNQYLSKTESQIEALIYLPSDEELAVSRRLTPDGKSKVTINGSLATVTQLAQTVKPLIAVHSQNDTHLITKAEQQLMLLDRYVGQEQLKLLEQFKLLYQQWQALKTELNSLTALAGEADNLKALYSFQLQELKNAQLTAGEDEQLSEELKKWQSQAEITAALNSCLQSLDEKVAPALNFIAKEVAKVAEFGLSNEVKQVEQLQEITNDLSFSLKRYLDSFNFNPEVFQQKQARLYQLNDLKRKYKMSLVELIEQQEKLELELEKITHLEEEINSKLPDEKKLAATLNKIAVQLSHNRHQAAQKIRAEVEKVLITLAMPQAKFSLNLEPLSNLNANGADQLSITVAFNPNQPLKPLNKVASGGELSRVMLALKTVVGKADNTPVLVFDEIDTGIGGQTAVNVGLSLAKLAQNSQVIVITHLPQIAAFAEHHLVVEKIFSGGKTVVNSRLVKENERLKELTKLSGLLSNSKLDMEHARLLVEQAQKAVRNG